MNRKTFVKNSLGMMGIALIPSSDLAFFSSEISSDPEPLDKKIVEEFVRVGHGKFDKVKEMLAEYPNLIYSRHDWGNGDFESAIEGAGHVGNKEIVNYLIEQGARVNLFILTVLGKTELVKPILEAYPALIQAKGAHGFTLLHHAKVGGEESKELFNYLQEKGLKETMIKIR